MMQLAIDRRRQTRGGLATSVVLHVAALLPHEEHTGGDGGGAEEADGKRSEGPVAGGAGLVHV